MLGSTEIDEPVELNDVQFETADWKVDGVSVGEGDTPIYLILSSYHLDLRNVDGYDDLRFYSSSPITSVEFVSGNDALNDPDVDFEFDYPGTGSTIPPIYFVNKDGERQEVNVTDRTIGSGWVSRPNPNYNLVRVSADENVTDGYIHLISPNPDNVTKRYITLKVTNGDGLSKYVVVEQYPLEYIQPIQGYFSYRDDFLSSGQATPNGVVCKWDETFRNGSSRTVPTSNDFFDSKVLRNGTVYTYSYPQKQLRFVRNYKYDDVKQEKESQYAQSIKLTNSKGYNQGRYDNVYKIYTSEALALYTAEVDNKENLKKEFEIKKEIAAIEKPSKSGSFFSNYYSNIKYRIAVNRVKTASPGMWLLVVVFVLTSIGAFFYYKLVENANWFQSFIGVPTSTGMRRLWMFNGGPYINVALYVGILLASFVSAVLVLLAVGGITYGVLWVVKILIVILIWVGWISLILGLIVLFLAKEGMGCLPIILGGVIVYFEDTLRNFGNTIVNWGFNFMNKLNLFDWGVSLFRNFWDVILTAFAMPLFVFILIALSVMALIFFLMGVEGGIMKIYGIRRPCPVCGSKKEKEYWADEMHKHPVKLQPGIYGVFSHIDPATKVKMPTLLIAGKDKLLRKCPQCGSFIHAGDTTSYGTERHIGIVGHRSSGKTYLIYSILNQILEQYGQLARQIDTDNTTNIESNFKRIQIRDKIQTVVRDSYRAIQIIIAPKLRPVPYHLFFYDVAGEKFNQTSTASKTAMDFYRNVNQIIFIIDPSMIDYTFSACSEKMSGWLQEHPSLEKYSIDGTFSTLKSILESVGRHPKDIDFMFVLVKADTGYMEYCGYDIDAKDEVIKTFMQSELGLTNIINAARGAFHKVEYDLVSVNSEFKIRMDALTERVLHNLNVK